MLDDVDGLLKNEKNLKDNGEFEDLIVEGENFFNTVKKLNKLLIGAFKIEAIFLYQELV